MTEHVATDALDQVALNRALGELLRHDEAETGVSGLTGQ
jgi:hypothetical protein